jgi:cell division protein FtsI (penicillin-binding protein 3)
MKVTRERVLAARHARQSEHRIPLIEAGFLICGVVILAKCFWLQVIQGGQYRLLATDQHELQRKLVPARGQILVRDRADQSLHPLATNRDAWTLYAVPREMEDVGMVAREIAPYAGKTEAELAERWNANKDRAYDPLAKGLDSAHADEIRSKNLKGIGLVKGWLRFYPESDIGGQLIGFVRTDDAGTGVGTYGIEGSLDETLAGTSGFVSAQKDASGRRLMLNGGTIRDAENGSDVVLTIDRTIQYETCASLRRAVAGAEAEGGTAIVMDPNTGAIIAMCSTPDFNPETYGETKDVSVFNNPATFSTYEPGSVFKAFTMALGIDREKVGPNTTYEDTGVVKIDKYEIKNSDLNANGTQTMTNVLEKSLNTGSIFVERQLGINAFREGVEAFGFGAKTGIELSPESKGNVSSLSKASDIYGATASFGQGITVTPLQLATAFSALANGGRLMRPYVVDEVIRPDGTREKTKPAVVRRPISERTSEIIRGMLVSVIEHGHGARASVPGYFVAGKTGTAQVANPNGPGYLKDVTMTTFAGFVPAGNPKLVIIARLVKPRAGKWAETNTAPLFHDIAAFALAYLGVPAERDAGPAASDDVPSLPAVTGTPDVVSVEGEGVVESASGTNSGTPAPPTVP